ncbi:hypothetical protein [Actinacidiphila sp. bgisy145]|uniref:hypothetical protein n=1 Tax=Actinacidiphila sp. bgisy145 TaxID=3413792 RepID=UPI003EBE16A2
MTRSSLPVAAVTAAALLLAACGGGSTSSDKANSSDSPTGSASATATTASPTQAAGPTAPKFDLPSDIKVNFDGFDSSDPTNKAVLLDATYAATSVVEMEALGKLAETPNLKRFFTGDHGAALADQMISYARTGKVATGTIRYYGPKVTVNKAAGSVNVFFCEDQSKAYDKDAKTGKVTVTEPSLRSYNSWTYVMSKASSGEWQVVDYSWVHGVKKCQAD